jgi:hypothetical protein
MISMMTLETKERHRLSTKGFKMLMHEFMRKLIEAIL